METPMEPTPGQQANLDALVGSPGRADVTGTPTRWRLVAAPEGDYRPWMAVVAVEADIGQHAEYLHWPALGEEEEFADEPTAAQATALAALIADDEARAVVEGVRTAYELVPYPDDERRPWRARWTVVADDGTTGTVDEWPDLDPLEQEALDATWAEEDAERRAQEEADAAEALAAYEAEQQAEFEAKVLAHPIVAELQDELAELKAKTSEQLAARDSVAGVLLGEIADLWEAMP